MQFLSRRPSHLGSPVGDLEDGVDEAVCDELAVRCDGAVEYVGAEHSRVEGVRVLAPVGRSHALPGVAARSASVTRQRQQCGDIQYCQLKAFIFQ